MDINSLTPDMILSMDAGIEMDALVATLVMGWHEHKGQNGSVYWADENNLYTHGISLDMEHDEEDMHLLHFNPSRSMLWITDVVAEKFSSYEIRKDSHGDKYIYRASVAKYDLVDWNEDWDAEATAPTPELAFCRAALLSCLKK